MTTIDLHTHSAVSDGTDTPTELVAKAAAAGIDVIALTDHDTFDGLDEARRAGERDGVVVLPGVEWSTQVDGSSIHLLGYGPRTDDPAVLAELAQVREGRSGRLPAMVAQLTAAGMPLTVADVMEFAGDAPSVGRPHVADAMVARGYVADRAEAFRDWLVTGKPGYAHRYATPLETAVDLLLGAGAVRIIAHPWGRGSQEQMSVRYLADLAARGKIDGIEVDHQDHDPSARDELRAFAEHAGLIITGSSDHHGVGKPDHDLGCNTTSVANYQRIVDLIRERGGTLGQ